MNYLEAEFALYVDIYSIDSSSSKFSASLEGFFRYLIVGFRRDNFVWQSRFNFFRVFCLFEMDFLVVFRVNGSYNFCFSETSVAG